jgi:hypothetical protein
MRKQFFKSTKISSVFILLNSKIKKHVNYIQQNTAETKIEKCWKTLSFGKCKHDAEDKNHDGNL